MFLSVMAKIGKAIYDRGIMPDDKIWLGHNYISSTYALVIDLKGRLRRVDDLAKEKKTKKIAAPLGCYEGIWSDTNNKLKDYPYLIYDRMGTLCTNANGYVVARERYLNKLKEASEYVRDDRITAVLKFALETDMQRILKSKGINLRPDDFFCISMIVDGKELNLWEDVGLKQRLSEFFMHQLKECKTKDCFCEVTGWEASYFITKHSQLITNDKARAVTTQCYKDEYGGDMDDFVVTQIGAESAAYYDFGILYLESKTYYARMEEMKYLEMLEENERHRQIHNDRIIYFGSIDGEVLLPVNLGPGWMVTYIKTKNNMHYKSFADFLRGKASLVPFCLVEYGVLDRRIVAYDATLYTNKESVKMIENILTWMRICQTSEKAYGVLDICKLLYGNNDLQSRSFFTQNILQGKWGDLAFTVLPACHWDANLYYPVIKMMRLGGFDMQKIMDEPDYLIGCLYAYAVLIERKHAYLVEQEKKRRSEERHLEEKKGEISEEEIAEEAFEETEGTNENGENRKKRQGRIKSMMTQYFQNPLETWKVIRIEIENLTNTEPNKYHILRYRISALEERLVIEDGWYLHGRNEGTMLIGYDCTMEKYYAEIKAMAIKEEAADEELCDNAVV